MRLNELKDMCKKLGVKPKPTKHRLNPDRYELSIEDCIKAIREHTLELLRTKNKLDPNLEFILKIKSPMLAMLISKQDKKTTNEIWDDNNTDWIFEEKLDGVRCYLTYNHSTDQYHIYSRALDKLTMLPVDYINRLKLNSNKIAFDFILDCELIFSNDMGHEIIEEILDDPYKSLELYRPKLVAFDLIRLGTYDLTQQTLAFRRREAFKLVTYLNNQGLNNLYRIEEKPTSMVKEEYYRYLVQKGYEGVIAKNITSTYDKNGKRAGEWTKIKKRRYEGTYSLNYDTYDLFVSGFVTLNNQVNGLKLSCYRADENGDYIIDEYGNRESIMLGTLYDIRPELKKLLTTYDDKGQATINNNFMFKVAEVTTSGYDEGTKKLNNINFVCWRLDKTYESCLLKDSEIFI